MAGAHGFLISNEHTFSGNELAWYILYELIKLDRNESRRRWRIQVKNL
jgi:hypothetical protein